MTRSQLVFGSLFVALGILLVADQAGLLTAWTVVADWWPTVVIAAGLAQLVTRPRNMVGGIVVSLLGGALLLWTLGFVDAISLVWPVLLIGLGLWLLAGRAGRPSEHSEHLEGRLDLAAVFDDRTATVTSDLVDGGAVTAILGDVELDLRRATLDEQGATLHVTTIFGDVTLDIPDGWQVSASGPELFGDVRLDRVGMPPPDAPGLRLRVLTMFGDIVARSGPLQPVPGTPGQERGPGS